MNTNLYGKTILIGREQEHSRLSLCVTAGGKPVMCAIGAPNSVPNSVSRCQPNEGKGHCSIEIGSDGRMMIANLKTQNVTCVDGNEVLKKYITEDSSVTLGRDQYPLEMKPIIDAAANMLARVTGANGTRGGDNAHGASVENKGKASPKTFSIAHLEKIQKDYNTKNEEIEKEQSMTMLLFRVPMIFSSIGAVVTAVAKSSDMKDLGNISLMLTLLGAVVTVYGIYKHMNNPAGKMKKDNLNKYKKNYVCPNPDCGRKLTNFDYEELQKIKKCPFCGCKFE